MKEMIEKVANKVSEYTYEYNKNKYDKDEWRELLGYIFYRTAIFTLFITTLVILSNLFKLDNDIYVFTISFLVLRRKFGGMHLQSEIGCFILSIMFPITIYILFKSTYVSNEIILLIYIISFIVLYNIGTIDNKVRKLQKNHKIKLQNQGYLLIALMLLINLYTESNFIAIALIFTVISCLIGKIQLKRS